MTKYPLSAVLIAAFATTAMAGQTNYLIKPKNPDGPFGGCNWTNTQPDTSKFEVLGQYDSKDEAMKDEAMKDEVMNSKKNQGICP